MNANKIDDIDIGIIEMLEEDPNRTHSDIAKELDRSQPAIGSRIHKLQERGILGIQYGIDFSQATNLKLVKIEMTADDPNSILELAKTSPNIINVLKVSGFRNLMVFMACSSLKRMDLMVDNYFRKNPHVKNVSMEMVTGFGKPFILPVDFKVENFINPQDPIKEKK